MRQKPALEERGLCKWFHTGGHPLAAKQLSAAARRTKAKLAPTEARFPPKGTRNAREFAVFLLHAAAEIEHSLLVQYLYAAYSINEQSEQDTNNFGMSWKADIRLVAREEMAHLITVQNLLLALNQDFYLNRGSLHRKGDIQPVPFILEPLSLESLAKYVVTESPSQDGMDDATKEEMKKVRRIANKLRHVEAISRVGILYTALYWLFLPSDDPGAGWQFRPRWIRELVGTYGRGFHLKESDFVALRPYLDKAASRQELGIYEANAHADPGSPRDAALTSIRWIMAQGEGLEVMEKSHFHRFLNIFEQVRTMGKKTFETLTFKVPVNPIAEYRVSRKGTTPIKNPLSKALGELLNIRYRLLLLDTMLFLDSSKSGAGNERSRYAKWAIEEMEFVKKIGQILPHRSLGRNGSSARAGAPFQTLWLPPQRSERLALQKQLVATSVNLLGEWRDKKIEHTGDPSADAIPDLVPGLLDSIARQDDRMRRVWDSR